MSRATISPASFSQESAACSLPSFRRWLWFSPALFAVHAAEDAPNLAEWMRRTRLFEPVSRGQLIVAMVLLMALCFLCAYAGRTGRRSGVYAFVWMQTFIFLHGLAHLITSVWFVEYTPGLVTGLFLLPFCYYEYRRARNYCWFGRKTAAVLLISAVLLYDPILRLAFKAGGAMVHQQQQRNPSPHRRPSDGNIAIRGTLEMSEG